MGRFEILIASALLSAFACAAPPPSEPWFELLRVADGLPSSEVYALRQDKDGFIWIGTRDGLARYDGIDFRVWRHDPADPASLATNDVAALLIDSRGRVWCGGEASGLNEKRADGSFRHYRHAANDAGSLSSDELFTIAEDAAGTIWIGTYLGGLNRLRDDGSFERIEHDAENPDSLRSTTVISLAGDAAGRLWIGTDIGLDVREADGRIVHVALPSLEARSDALSIGSLRAQDDGSMLVGTDFGVLRIGADLRFAGTVFESPSRMPTTVTISESNADFWIGTTAGLLRMQGDVSHRYGGGDALPGELPSTRVMDVLRDREGGLWVAMFDAGVARLPARWRSFSIWRHRAGDEHSLLHTHTEGVSIDERGGIWVSSGRDGLDHIDAVSGKVDHHGARLGAKGSQLRALLQVGNELWVGHQRGIRIYALADAKLTELAVAADSAEVLPRGYANHLLRAPDGFIWASLRGGGVARIDPNTHAIHAWSVTLGTLIDADITDMTFDSAGQPWISSGQGVQRFDARADRFVPVAGSPREAVHALAFDGTNALWMHRLGALERYQLQADSLHRVDRYTSEQGWPAMQVSALHVAADHSLWAASQRGLWRIDPQHHRVRQFNERDGLPSAELIGGFALARDGSVYVSSREGVIAFDPAAISLDTLPPPLQLTGVTIRRDGVVRALDPTAKIDLSHGDQDLAIEARVLSFLNPAGNDYQYKLEGFDENWVNTGARGERVFSQLPAGKYVLKIRAANADGVWSANTASLPIDVSAAPWMTPWAYLAYVIGLVLLAGLSFRIWRQRVDQRHSIALADEQRRAAEQVAEAKSAFLANMSHEIRTPMTGVLGMAELLRGTALDDKQRGYAEAISRSGDLMLRLVNDSLDLARMEAGKLQLDSRPLQPRALLREVIELEQPLARKKNLKLSIEVDKSAPDWVIGDALRIKQVLFNLVNNAIKFTEHGSITLGMAKTAEGTMIFKVSDSGPGMNADMRERLFGRFEQSNETMRRFGGSGLGLAICQDLVELMGGRIAVESVLGRGTCFTISLPLEETVGNEDHHPEMSTRAASSMMRVAANTDAFGQRRFHVLVVEDDATIAAVVSAMLERAGHRSTHAAHGLAALAALAEPDIDLALIDLDLPGIDGLQLTRLVRERERESGKHLPIIAITARSSGDEETQTQVAGMDGFLRKPISAAQLEAALAQWVSEDAKADAEADG